MDRNDTLVYKTNNKKLFQRIWIFVICEKYIEKVWKKLLDTATKTEIESTKNCFQGSSL